jgi:hypothetical protein
MQVNAAFLNMANHTLHTWRVTWRGTAPCSDFHSYEIKHAWVIIIFVKSINITKHSYYEFSTGNRINYGCECEAHRKSHGKVNKCTVL